MVRMLEEPICYNIYCLYQWRDHCLQMSITIDKDGHCATCQMLCPTEEELKAMKEEYYGIELEDTSYKVERHYAPDNLDDIDKSDESDK